MTLTLGRVMLVITLFIWVAQHLRMRTMPVFDRRILYWMAAVLLFDLGTCFYTISRKLTLQSVGVKLEPLLLFLMLTDCFRDRGLYRKILTFGLLLWAGNAAYGIFQELGAHFGFPTEIPFLQAHITKFYYQGAPMEAFNFSVRARSFFHDPNSLAGYLALYLPLITAFVILPGRRLLRRLLWLAVLALGVGGILVTSSRSGLLAMTAGLVVFFLATSARALWKTSLVVVGIALLVVYLIKTEPFSYLRERLDPNDSGARYHMLSIESAYDIFLSHPILGVGYGAFAEADPVVINPHNVYVQFLSEGGIVGFALEMAFIVLLSAVGWRRVRRSKTRERALIAAGFLAGFAGLLGFNVTYWFYYNSVSWFFLAFYFSYESGVLSILPPKNTPRVFRAPLQIPLQRQRPTMTQQAGG